MERFPTAADHEATCDQMCRQLSLDGPATEATCCTAREILWLLTPCAGTCKCLANRPNDVIDTTQLRYICRSAEAGNPARNSAALIAATSSCHRSSRPARSCLIVNCSGLDCRYVGVFEQCVLTSVLHSMIVYTLEFLFLFCFVLLVRCCFAASLGESSGLVCATSAPHICWAWGRRTISTRLPGQQLVGLPDRIGGGPACSLIQ